MDNEALASQIYGGRWGDKIKAVSLMDWENFEGIFDAAFHSISSISRVVNAAYAAEYLCVGADFKQVFGAYADPKKSGLPDVLVDALNALNTNFLIADLDVSAERALKEGFDLQDIKYTVKRFRGMTLNLADEHGYFSRDQKLERGYGPNLSFNPSTFN